MNKITISNVLGHLTFLLGLAIFLRMLFFEYTLPDQALTSVAALAVMYAGYNEGRRERT